MPDFSRRSKEREIMDDLDCGGEVVDQTLRELEIINRWLGGNRITLDGVRHLVRGHEKETLSIADLGCGSGEMLCRIADWGRKNNQPLSLTGIDANPNIIAYARNHCRAYPEINFTIGNIFSEDFMKEKYDIVIGTLFYHHFSGEALIQHFTNLKVQARIGIVINDLHRHSLAYYSIRVLTKLFSRSAMVKYDAPLSVLRAFTRNELSDILFQAGIENAKISWKWAFRWQVWHSFY